MSELTPISNRGFPAQFMCTPPYYNPLFLDGVTSSIDNVRMKFTYSTTTYDFNAGTRINTIDDLLDELTSVSLFMEGYDVWPMLGKTALIMVMFIGAMAGSTAGGIKVSRIVISIKGAYINVRKLINPRYVPKAKFEGKTLEPRIINDVFAFITLYFFIFLVTLFLLSFDSANGTVVQIASDAGYYQVKHGFFSNFSATLTCISNVGPAFEAVGPYSSFAGYSSFSMVVLTLTMLLGRLEILPVLILLNRRTWKKI